MMEEQERKNIDTISSSDEVEAADEVEYERMEEDESEVDGAEAEIDDQKKNAPGFLEVIYGMFFSPAVTFRLIAIHPMMGKAIVFFLLVQLLSTINAVSVIKVQFPDLVGAGFSTFFPVLILLMALTGWFLNTAVLQLLAEFQGGKGRGVSLFTALGFAYAPSLFSAPAGLLLSDSFPGLYNLVTFLLTVWVIVLSVMAIKSVHDFSTGKAIWTLVIPLLGVLFMLFVVVVLTVLVIMGMGLTEFPGLPGL